MTFLERPIPTDNNDVCIWRDRISGAVIENEGTGGPTYNLTSSGGISVDTAQYPFFSAIVCNPQYYKTDNVAQFDISNGFTISAWIRVNTIGSLDRIIVKQNQATWTSPQYDTIIFFNTTPVLASGTLASVVTATTLNAATVDEWIHIGMTIDPAGTTLSFYDLRARRPPLS